MVEGVDSLVFDIEEVFEGAEEAISFNELTQKIIEESGDDKYWENYHAEIGPIMCKIPGYEKF